VRASTARRSTARGTSRSIAPASRETNIVYWTNASDGGFERHELDDFDTAKKLQPQVRGQPGVVAVYFPAFDTTFVHPNVDVETETISSWGTGNQTADRIEGHPAFDEHGE